MTTRIRVLVALLAVASFTPAACLRTLAEVEAAVRAPREGSFLLSARSGGPVALSATFTLAHIVELNEKRQYLGTSFSLFLNWTDRDVAWDVTATRNVTKLLIPAKSVRIPDITLSNHMDRVYGFWEDGESPVIVDSSGSFSWAPTFNGRTVCRLGVEFFPFDTQVCKLVVGTWFSDLDALSLHLPRRKVVMYKEKFTTNSQWNLEDNCIRRSVHVYQTIHGQYPEMHIVLKIKRIGTLEVLQLLLPGFLIFIQIFLGFWLPLDSPGKPSLGMTVFLAATVQSGLVDAKTPATKPFPVMGILYSLNMIMATLQVFFTVFVLVVRYQGNLKTEMPWRLRRFLDSAAALPLIGVKSGCPAGRRRRRKFFKTKFEIEEERFSEERETQLAAVRARGFGYIRPEDLVYVMEEEQRRLRASYFRLQSLHNAQERAMASVDATTREGLRAARERWVAADLAAASKSEWEALALYADRIFFIAFLVVYGVVVPSVFASALLSGESPVRCDYSTCRCSDDNDRVNI